MFRSLTTRFIFWSLVLSGGVYLVAIGVSNRAGREAAFAAAEREANNDTEASVAAVDDVLDTVDESVAALARAVSALQLRPADIDQLVSTGEWRNGITAAVEGMLKSSANSPGTRTLTVDKIRMISSTSAIVDCRYEIQNTNNTTRKMWSTFIVIADKEIWKISAIRNMLPANN